MIVLSKRVVRIVSQQLIVLSVIRQINGFKLLRENVSVK
jgi:hypothetical protein